MNINRTRRNEFFRVVKIISFLSFSLSYSSCSQQKETPISTPISGILTLFADESLRPMVKAEIQAFHYLYNEAKIEAEFKSEDEAIMALLNNRAESIIIGRELNIKEKAFIRHKNISIRSHKIGVDGIAIIANEFYPDSVISLNQLKNILSGMAPESTEIYSQSTPKDFRIVFDKSSSGILNFLQQKLELENFSKKMYAAESISEAMDYVRKNNTAIGLIGANWISDEDDPALLLKLKHLKVLAISKAINNAKDAYQPLQSNLVNELYALSRPVYIIYKSSKTGLNTGFASFILSDRGQRIILKSGLLPFIMPGREILITNNNY